MKRLSTLFSLTITIVALSLLGFANSARCQDVVRPTLLSAVFDNANTEIIITYSEPMEIGPAMELSNYYVTEPSGNVLGLLSVIQEDAAGAQYRLPLETAAVPGSTLTVFFVMDLAGNTIDPDPTTIPIQGPPDTTPPTVVSAVFANVRTAIVVLFSETMHQGQAEEPANYFVTEPSGAILEVTSVTLLAGTGGMRYLLNLNATASSGSELTVFEVSDVGFNVIDPNPTTLPIQDSGDETRPTVLSTELGDSNTKVFVTFSETMHLIQTFNAANYVMTGPSGENVPIIGVSQANAEGTQFRLHLGAVGSPGSQLTISNVTDLALNVIAPNPTTISVPGTAGDTTPPTVSATVSTNLLTPPNHKLVNVGLTVTASDNVTANPTINVQVLSDEALAAGDASYINGVLSLRAIRDNFGDGRVYVIVVTATDQAGNVASTCTTVVVPFSNSPADIASVQAQAAAACP